MMLLILLPLATALLCIYIVLKSSIFYRKLEREFPAPPSLPVIGHAKTYWGDGAHLLKTVIKFRKELGTRWVVRMLNEFAINICDAEGVEAVMTSSKNIKKGPLYELLLQWLGRGLLTNFGPSWHHRRKLLTPAFHFKVLDEFGPMIFQHSKSLVRDVQDLVDSDKNSIDIVLPVSKVTLATICETAMGVALKDCGKEDEYFLAVRKVGTSVAYRLVRPWTWRDIVFNFTPYGIENRRHLKTLHSITMQVIKERKSFLDFSCDQDSKGQALRKRRLAFLDMLLAAQRQDPNLTDEDIREEVDTFLFEGHETTAMAISWTLFLLGNHPDIQQRVRDEVLSAGDDWQAVSALPYLEMVVKESLRLYPPVFYISRENEHGQSIGEKTVPPGVHLDVQIYLTHRDPAVFPDPERFDPERFTPEQEQGRHPFAYVPFSGGLRNCIGKRFAMMEVKLMVAAFVGAFSFRSQHSQDEIEYRPELVLRPKQGILLYITSLNRHDL